TSDSDEAFADYCGTSGSGVIGFLNTLSPIIEKLQTAELNSDVLFDGRGRLKDVRELMQLLVAPKCLGPQNRKPLGVKLYCQDGYHTIRSLKDSNKTPAEKVKALREKVVMSLVQGLPLGNAFPVNSTVSHINTIAGLRFNPQKNQ